MPLFRVQEGNFQVPSIWEDDTKNVFFGGVDATGPFTLVISRDPAARGKESEEYADAQLEIMAKQFNGYRLLARRNRRVGGLPAHQVDFTRDADGQPVFQRQVFLPLRETCLIFTITCQKRIQGQAERQIEQMFISFEPHAV